MVELFAAVVIWGLSFALAKKALNHLHPLELVTIRLFLAAMTVTAIQWARIKSARYASAGDGRRAAGLGGADRGQVRGPDRGQERHPDRGAEIGQERHFNFGPHRGRLAGPSKLAPVILGVFEFSGTYILYTWSLKYLPSGVVGTLTLLTPAVTFLVALLFGVQVFRGSALLGTVLSVLGAWLCLPPKGLATGIFTSLSFSHDVILGLILIMASNFMFATGNVAITRYQRLGSLGPYTTANGLWLGALISLLIGLASGAAHHDHDLSLTGLALPLYLGVVATGVGFYLWNRGVEKTSALKASFIGNFKAPLSLLWGALLLGESLSPRLFLGVVILLTATGLVRTNGKKSSGRESALP